MPVDESQGWKDANSQVEALKSYVEVSKDAKSLKSKTANSNAPAFSKVSEGLNKIAEQQKRFQKSVPTSMDNLLNLFGKTKGNGPETFKYLRRKLLEVAAKMEPDVRKIIQEESLKAIGCSQQQTYKAISPSQLEQIGSINSLPQQEGIYLPVQSLDFMGNLKISPNTRLGLIYYEFGEPSASPLFRPYGGQEPFPMNKELNLRMNAQNTNRSFNQEYGKFFQGTSLQKLFDFQYTNNNSFNIPGDYFRIILLDRTNEDGSAQGGKLNNVGQFLYDYYSTVKIVETKDFMFQLINLLTGAVSIQQGLGYDDLTSQSKFALLVQRILGLCVDNRKEIDVSGVAKISEFEGLDDKFFEFNNVDLRNIELEVSNVQLGVMEFEDCGGVKLPVNSDLLVNELSNFATDIDNLTIEQQVSQMESILDSIAQNPEWKLKVPSSFNADLSINKNIIKKIPLAIVAAFLTPKNLLPIYTMLSVVQSAATYTINQQITSANTFISSANTTINSANTLTNQTSNVVNNGVEFLIKFKNFNFEVITRVGALFIQTLFELLKRDLLNLVNIIIKDVLKGKYEKYVASCQRLIQFLIILAQLIKDYRNCKNLLDDILAILRLINGIPRIRQKIPLSLLLMSDFLPGYSPVRAKINGIQIRQSLGLPTGNPFGGPNLMEQAFSSLIDGDAKEWNENGVSDITVGIPYVGKISIPNKIRIS